MRIRAFQRVFVHLAGILAALLGVCSLPGQALAADILALKSSDIKPYGDALEGFRRTCGCSIREYTVAELQGRLAATAAEMKSPAVLAIGLDALKEALPLTHIPVVYVMVPSHPASARQNLSGVSMQIPVDRQMAAIKKTFPAVRRIGVVYDQKNSEAHVAEAQKAAKSFNLELVRAVVRDMGDVPEAIDGMKGRIDLFWMLPDPTVFQADTISHLFLFSFSSRIPVFSFSKKFVDQGAVAALTSDSADMGAQAGELAGRILSGEGGALRLKQDARRPILLLNRKIAQKLEVKLGEQSSGGDYDVR